MWSDDAVLAGADGEVRLERDGFGTARVRAASERDLALGTGYAHARDRLVQMCLVRLVAQGRLGECLEGSDEALEIDSFARRMGFAASSEAEVEALSPESREWLDAYCRGVDLCRSGTTRPMEFLVAGYDPEPWEPAHTLMTLRVMSFVGLAEGQQDAEKWIVQALRRGVDPDVLRSLFAPHLDGLDQEILEAIRSLVHVEPLVPDAVRAASALPRLRASNNWVVAGRRTSSGKPVQANDPHLEGNRLPAIWYELIGELPDDYRIGISMPGLPGIVMGRNSRVSAGFTYGFMDMVDYFVEDCRDGSRRVGDEWVPFERRVELIKRKDREPLRLEIFETARGILEGHPRAEGYYLSMAWASYREGTARSVDALRRFQAVRTVEEAREVVREVAISCNWLMADRDGRIAYQQSGHLPERRHSGLHPVPGWDPELAWQGDVDPARLATVLDPEDGFLVTANDHFQAPGAPVTVNLHMGDYRARQIRSRLITDERCDVEGMRALQQDLFSEQAREYMELLRPVLPEGEIGERLRDWGCTYEVESQEAVWFEAIWERLLSETFGRFLGAEFWEYTLRETAIVTDYHWFFDRAFLGEDEGWFPGESREELCRRVCAAVLAEPPTGTWGERNCFVMKNLFFGGKLPGWLGFDRGPIPVPGCRATPSQGQVFRTHGRQTSFLPTWRYVTDLAEDGARTSLAGGPSGSRFSRWYTSELERWLRGEDKPLEPSAT